MARLTVDPVRAAREARNAEASDAADRTHRRRWLRLFVGLVGVYLAGTAVAFSSMGTSDEARAELLLWLGLSIGNVGAFLVFVFFLVGATRRGDA
jgi:hypothetical protein